MSSSETLSRQMARLQQHTDRRQRWSNRYSWARVLIFFGGLLAAAVAFYTTVLWVSVAIVIGTIILFAISVYLHQRVSSSLARFTIMQQIKRFHLARIAREWNALPPPLESPLRYEHPFEADLDLLGPRSLHRLLNTAATRPGSDRLHDWLTVPTPPTIETIQTRQALVCELIPRSLFRDRMTLQGLRLSSEDASNGSTPAQAGWQPDRLLAWLSHHPTTVNLRPWVWVSAALAVINWLLFGADQLGWLAPYWRITLVIYAILQLRHGDTISETFHAAGTMQGELEQLLRVFQRLERNGYQRAPHLATLCAPFRDAENRPSHALRRIARIAAATGVQGNPIIALAVNALVPWGLYFAWQLGKEREKIAALLPDWLDCWAELEALSALATFGALNPQSTFPLLNGTSRTEPAAVTSPIFSVNALGHPLLPNLGKVRNDFAFVQLGNVVILTGSNMAGKSTFLKALALNLVLTYAGGVVDAEQLSTQRFRLFTCIKVSDSVTDGISYFYAEVRRLKSLLDALEQGGATADALPLFYVIDEIFRGTNNRERLEGSRAYIRALAAQAGVGLVATHDLELVHLADALPTILNYHFRDDIVDGEMHFDYRLRPGPSPTTNALKIMRHAGLPVDLTTN
ncbi:MAG: hypothetical protein KDE19_21725 [Caldilineaceae bacterium]|nr:hypothetical protein [Caldilineaceae bacterium]